MKGIKLIIWLMLASWSLACGVLADDTDIYLTPSVPTGAEPLVMFSLDYRSNLGSTACNDTECDQLISEGYLPPTGPYTFFDVLRGVLRRVLEPIEGIKVGFMLNHNDNNNCAGPQDSRQCSNGGYILSGFESLKAGDSNSAKQELDAKLMAIPTPQGNVSHSYQGKELFFEFFRYLTGQGIYNGHNGWTDYGTNSSQNLPDDNPSVSWDTPIENGASYESPLLSVLECTTVYTINFLFQVSNQEDDSDDAITASKASGGMGGINLNGRNNEFSTVIRYLREVDLADGSYGSVQDLEGNQNVVSYFLIDPNQINTTTNGYASAGGTGNALELSRDPEELTRTLESIFRSILSVSTTFVAPSVPVNVFNRAETVNEVFLSLFQPEENGFPQWVGNLKKLNIDLNPVSGIRELQDVFGNNAIDIDGRIKRDALTLWTNGGTLPPPANDDEFAGRDGRSVARGGAGQNVPGFVNGSPGQFNGDSNARQLYTELASAPEGLMPFNADAVTAAELWSELTEKWSPQASGTDYSEATTAEQRKAVNLLRFARGLEDDGITTRQWIMGDPLHSRPLPVNYGARSSGYTISNPDIRVLLGTNDGFMRMFRNTRSDGSQDGQEIWGFAPRSVLPMLDRLRANSAGTPVHPVTVDGSPAVLTVDQNLDGNLKSSEGDLVYAYFGLRRGGKSYYALDISEPDNPRHLWTIDKGAAGSDFAELAQSWSTPQVGHIKYGDNVIPVLVFGGGYNGDDDGDNTGDLGKDAANRIEPQTTGVDDDEGNAIYIVNALDGSLVWKVVQGVADNYNASTKSYRHPEMKDSIPADVSAVDTTGDGLFDRIYAADSGGVVWRIDLAGQVDTNNDGLPDSIVAKDPSLWTVKQLLNVGRHAFAGNLADDRRFFNRPDIVQSRDDTGPFDAVILGSGDRENPKGELVDNWFYMIKDRGITSGKPLTTTFSHANIADLSDNCLQSDSCSTAPNLVNGWRIRLEDAGEKNLSSSITAGGAIFFTTFAPTTSASACQLSEGNGYFYALGLQDASALYNFSQLNDESGNMILERRDLIASGGIPVEVVPLGMGEVLIQGRGAGENIIRVPGKTSFKTHWITR